MRILQILGAILIAGGLFVLIKAPSYSSEKSVFKIGDVEAKVSQQQEIPAYGRRCARGRGGFDRRRRPQAVSGGCNAAAAAAADPAWFF